MSGATLRAEFDGDQARRAVRALALAGRDPSVLLKPVATVLVRGTRDRMAREMDPEGNPWEPLQPWYAELKRSSRMLKESGALEGSIVYEVSGRELAIGSKLPYSAVHQFGAVIEPVNGPLLIFHTADGHAWGAATQVFVPARPYLGISEDDERHVMDVTEQVLWRISGLR